MARWRDWMDRVRTPALVLGAGLVVYLFSARGANPLDDGGDAPPFEVETDQGTVQVRGGEVPGVTVVNFWGTYCPPCREEAPVLARAHARLRDVGGRVLGLSTDRAPLADVVRQARSLGMRYPIAVASEDLLTRYRVTLLPTTYVLRPDGRIAASFVGAVSGGALDRAIEAAAH